MINKQWNKRYYKINQLFRKFYRKELLENYSSRFLNYFRTLMSAGLPSIKTVLTPLAQSFLIPLGLIAAASAKGAAI